MLEVRNITKSFKHQTVLKDINFNVKENEFICIVGPSGCGKTTLLRIIAGLDNADSGEVLLDGEKIEKTGKDRGMVFQEYSLFPWRTVEKNIEFGLEFKGVPKEERKSIIKEKLDLVHLSGEGGKYPHELSGGMKQRVAIARELARDPKILLMDEPFGAVDAQTRNMLQDELLEIWRETRKEILFITHNVDEAVYLADRILILSSTPAQIKKSYDIDLKRPRDRTDSKFVEKRREILHETLAPDK